MQVQRKCPKDQKCTMRKMQSDSPPHGDSGADNCSQRHCLQGGLVYQSCRAAKSRKDLQCPWDLGVRPLLPANACEPRGLQGNAMHMGEGNCRWENAGIKSGLMSKTNCNSAAQSLHVKVPVAWYFQLSPMRRSTNSEVNTFKINSPMISKNHDQEVSSQHVHDQEADAQNATS